MYPWYSEGWWDSLVTQVDARQRWNRNDRCTQDLWHRRGLWAGQGLALLLGRAIRDRPSLLHAGNSDCTLHEYNNTHKYITKAHHTLADFLSKSANFSLPTKNRFSVGWSRQATTKLDFGWGSLYMFDFRKSWQILSACAWWYPTI